MSTLNSGMAALVLIAGLSGTAQAQRFVGGGATNAGVATFPGGGTTLDFGMFNGGYGNFGQPAIYPNYPGHGYGSGRYAGGYYSTLPSVNAPVMYNNMGGLMGSIKQQTGKPGSYRNSPYGGVARPRRGR